MAAIVNDRDLVLQAAVPRYYRLAPITAEKDGPPWTNKATDTFDPVVEGLNRTVATGVTTPAGSEALLYLATGAGAHRVVGGTAISLTSSSTPFKVGIYVKLNSGSYGIALKLAVASGGTLRKGVNSSLVEDTAVSSVGSGYSNVSFVVQRLTDGWAKLSVTGVYTKSGSEPTVDFSVVLLNGTSETFGGGGNGYYIYGPTLFLDEQPDEKIGDTWTDKTTKVTSPWNGHAWLTPESALGTKQGVVYLYRRSLTVLTDSDKPDDNVFDYSINDFTAAPTNSWTRTIPTSNGQPCYVIACTPVDDDGDNLATVLTEDWADPIILTKDGAKTAIVYLYQRTTSSTAPSVAEPTSVVTYTFESGVSTPSDAGNGWNTTIPTTGGKYLWVIQAVAFNSLDTDNIDVDEWSVPKILAQDGADGADGEVVAIETNSMVVAVEDNNTHTPSTITLTLRRGESINGGTPSTTSYVWAVISGTFTGSTATVNAATGQMTAFNPATAMGSDQVQFQCTYTHNEPDTPYHGRSYTDKITIIKLREAAGLSGSLTNDNHSLPSDNTGAVQAYTGASGTFKVYYGTVDVTEDSTFSLVSDYGFNVGQSPAAPSNNYGTKGNYSVTAGVSNAVAVATATYRATYVHPVKGSLSIDKIFTLAKSIEGPAGEGISCQSNSLITSVSELDVHAPDSITLSVLRGSSIDGGSPSTASYVWSVLAGTFTGSTATVNSTTGQMTAFTPSTHMGTDQVQFQCVYTHNQPGSSYHNKIYTDRITITKVYESAGLSGILTNDSHGLPTDSANTITSYVGAAGQFQVYYGALDVTEDCTFSVQSSTGFSTAPPSPSNSPGTRGDYSVSANITASPDAATVTYLAVYNHPTKGTMQVAKTFTITKFVAVSVAANAIYAYKTVESTGMPSPASVGVPTGAATVGNAPHATASTTWYTSPPSGALASNLWVFQCAGTFDGTTYEWQGPAFLATFRVGKLEALSADMGTLTAGSINTSGYGIFAGNSAVNLYAPTASDATMGPSTSTASYTIALLGNVNGSGTIGTAEIGVYGITNNTIGKYGVVGWCENPTEGTGVVGRGASYGLVGHASGGSTTAIGVHGGVKGNVLGITEWGVVAYNDNPTLADGIDKGSLLAVGHVKVTEGSVRITPLTGEAPIITTSTAVCTGLNADMVDGRHVSGTTFWNVLVGTGSDGVTEAGKFVDLHASSSDSTDYAVRLIANSSSGATGDGRLSIVQKSGFDNNIEQTVLAGIDAGALGTNTITATFLPAGLAGAGLKWVKAMLGTRIIYIPYIEGDETGSLGAGVWRMPYFGAEHLHVLISGADPSDTSGNGLIVDILTAGGTGNGPMTIAGTWDNIIRLIDSGANAYTLTFDTVPSLGSTTFIGTLEFLFKPTDPDNWKLLGAAEDASGLAIACVGGEMHIGNHTGSSFGSTFWVSYNIPTLAPPSMGGWFHLVVSFSDEIVGPHVSVGINGVQYDSYSYSSFISTGNLVLGNVPGDPTDPAISSIASTIDLAFFAATINKNRHVYPVTSSAGYIPPQGYPEVIPTPTSDLGWSASLSAGFPQLTDANQTFIKGATGAGTVSAANQSVNNGYAPNKRYFEIWVNRMTTSTTVGIRVHPSAPPSIDVYYADPPAHVIDLFEGGWLDTRALDSGGSPLPGSGLNGQVFPADEFNKHNMVLGFFVDLSIGRVDKVLLNNTLEDAAINVDGTDFRIRDETWDPTHVVIPFAVGGSAGGDFSATLVTEATQLRYPPPVEYVPWLST